LDELTSYEAEIQQNLDELKRIRSADGGEGGGGGSVGSAAEDTIQNYLSGKGEKKLMQEIQAIIALVEVWPKSRERALELRLKNCLGVYREWHRGYRARLKNFLAIEEQELKEEDEAEDLMGGEEAEGGVERLEKVNRRRRMTAEGTLPKPPGKAAAPQLGKGESMQGVSFGPDLVEQQVQKVMKDTGIAKGRQSIVSTMSSVGGMKSIRGMA
jgi:hypothetical protein